MNNLPSQYRDSSVVSCSLSHPQTPARNSDGSKRGAGADGTSDRTSSDRLGPVSDERLLPTNSHSGNGLPQQHREGDEEGYMSHNILNSVDQLLKEDGSYQIRSAPDFAGTPSPEHHGLTDTSMPSLGGDSSTFDSSHSFEHDHEGERLSPYHELAFSPLRMNQRRGKPQSSPGAKAFIGEATSFFEDLGVHTASHAPLESTPRRGGSMAAVSTYPNTLPRVQMHHRRPSPANEICEDDSSSPDRQLPPSSSDSAFARDSPQKAASKPEDLQDRLSASQIDRARLQEQCHTMSHEIANLKDALQQLAYPQTRQYLQSHLAQTNEAVANPVWGPHSPALGGGRRLYPQADSPAGGWSGRHSPAISDMKSCEGSPSMGYIGLSLINCIQAQLQAGMEGQAPSPRLSPQSRLSMPQMETANTRSPSTAGGSHDAKYPSPSTMKGGGNLSSMRRNPASYVTGGSEVLGKVTNHTTPFGSTEGMSPSEPTTFCVPQGAQPPWLSDSALPNTSGVATTLPYTTALLDSSAERSSSNLNAFHHPGAGSQQQNHHFTQFSYPHGAPALPVKPRHSAPAVSTPYMPVGFGGGAGGAASGSIVSPYGVPASRTRGVDALTPPEVLVARALSGRSQEASILLQQQLKSGSDERQALIIRAITPHLLTLSEDKHGNFLIQRAIGVDVSVAWKLQGSFARLALSQYGCHVIQRVLDEGEPLKAAVVEELLSQNLLETLTSRNSVHIWAKALEIKWSSNEFRKKVFQVINAAMRGHWASTAMQETGSIVVQNVFESAQGSEKQDCIEEILDRLPDCAANQWGVWVVQHIIEHGDDGSRAVAFERLLSEAEMLSISQFGQKAIMTALKSRDSTFVGGYLDLLCDGANVNGSANGGEGNGQSVASNSGSSGRRSMLVDIASTPQGLQILTQLLTTIDRNDRERIIKAVRKNSVFLKGTKTGLKVHQMCERARAFTGY